MELIIPNFVSVFRVGKGGLATASVSRDGRTHLHFHTGSSSSASASASLPLSNRPNHVQVGQVSTDNGSYICKKVCISDSSSKTMVVPLSEGKVT